MSFVALPKSLDPNYAFKSIEMDKVPGFCFCELKLKQYFCKLLNIVYLENNIFVLKHEGFLLEV